MVLDASVASSWLLEDAGAGQEYAGAVFDTLASEGEARGILPSERSRAFLAALAAAPIICDPDTYSEALTDTLDLSRRYRLSAYDASDLELALRVQFPLVTLDADLQRAATKAGAQVLKII